MADEKNYTVNFSEIDNLNATVFLSRSSGSEAQGIEYQLEGELPDMSTPDFNERFKFICYFAAGGMGQVGKAKDMTFDRVVAVKTLKDKHRDDPRVVKAFIEECRLNAQLDHPSIVPVYSMGKRDDGGWEVMMKLINGSSLGVFIKKAREGYGDKKISFRQEQYALFSRLEYFLKICEVIDYCHSRKIVHGDLKPDNIMMGQFGEVYVMDWGCARYMNSTPEHVSGTPNYLPPEFIKHRKVTVLIDVYALGMVLFELATLLRSKSSTSSVTAASTRHNVHEPEIWHFQPGMKVSPALKAIINKATNIDPVERYQSVNELAMDVRHFIYNEEVSSYPDNWFRRGVRVMYNNRLKTVLVIASCFIVMAALLFFSYYRANQEKQELDRSMMQRGKLQVYTDDLAVMLRRKIFLAHSQILLFADNLVEFTRFHNPDKSVKYYTNEDYKNPATSPPGMTRVSYYPNPINLENMVRFPSAMPPRVELMDGNQFVYICRKVIGAEFDSQEISKVEQGQILTDANVIQRLFVCWENKEGYSYPGAYDNPRTEAYSIRWNSPDNYSDTKRISWSLPYLGNSGFYRIICRHPLFTYKGEYLGMAAMEMRFEKLLDPLLKARAKDPAHKFYFINERGRLVVYITATEVMLPDSDGNFPDGVKASDILAASDRLNANNFQQFVTKVGDRNHFVSGAKIDIIESTLVLAMDAVEMKHHQHND